MSGLKSSDEHLRMHDRYFFAGGAKVFLLAVAGPRTWPIVLLIQTANLCAYTRFLLSYSAYWLHRGVILMTCAINSLLWQLFFGGASSSPKCAAGTS